MRINLITTVDTGTSLMATGLYPAVSTIIGFVTMPLLATAGFSLLLKEDASIQIPLALLIS